MFKPIRFIPDNVNINFMGIRKINIGISIIVMILSILCVLIKGINFGIDFTGGTMIEAKLNQKPDIISLYKDLSSLNIGDVKIQDFESDNIMIKIGNKHSGDDSKEMLNSVKNSLFAKYPEIEYRKIEQVGPQVGNQLIQKGLMATLLSFLAIMVYVAIRFEWQYGVGMLFSLLHDLIATVGFMSLFSIEFDLTSIAAILTVVGYSVNDSVVIYDRIRENLHKYKKISLTDLINKSINETISRTTMTVMTTLISVISLIFFGGTALFAFSIVIFFGILIGTYSSIYTSATILIYLNLNNKN